VKKINIIANKSYISNLLLAPVRYNLKKFKSENITININYVISEKNLSSDVLIIFSKPIIELVQEKEEVFQETGPIIQFLKKARSFAGKLIWFDSTDGAGMPHFEVMPYIDLYFKGLMYKDKTIYKKELYGGRLFTDYYHRNNSIIDENEIRPFHPLEDKYLHKLKLSWTLGLGDIYNLANIMRRKITSKFVDYLPANYNFKFVSPSTKRSIDVFLKFSATVERNTVSYHRKIVLDRIKKIGHENVKLNIYTGANGRSYIDLLKGDFFSFKKYHRVMSNSKLIIGPFSYGDINGRDYESIINGTLLLKPDISYIDVYPNLLINEETYLPFDWDLKNLNLDMINKIIIEDTRRIELVKNAQKRYKSYFSKQGLDQFCHRFIQLCDN